MKSQKPQPSRSENEQTPRPCLTGRGRNMLIAAIVILITGLVISDAALIQISLCWLLLTVLALPFSLFNMHGLTYERRIPDAVYKGKGFNVGITIKNSKKHLESFDLEIRDRIMARNYEDDVLFTSITPGRANTQQHVARINRRGIYDGFQYDLISSFPLGLAFYRKTAHLPGRIVVYPPPKLPPDVRSVLEAEGGFGRSRVTASTDVTGEFRSMRQYQPGDHIKLVSWPTSTRFQELIVKEMEHPGPQEVTVIFHSHQPANTYLSRLSFERSLQLLSGLFSYLYNSYIPFDFCGSFNQFRRIPVQMDSRSLKEAMESLASARMSISKNPSTIVKAVRNGARSSVSVVIVSNCPVKYWADIIPPLNIPVVYIDNSGAGLVQQEIIPDVGGIIS